MFSCSSCGQETESGRAGDMCPACRAGILREGAGGPATAAAPAPYGATVRSGGGGSGALKIAGALVAVGLVFAGINWGPILKDRITHKSRSVAGEFASELLDLHLTFPRGWRHVVGFDSTQEVSGSQLAGGQSLSPEQLAAVGTAAIKMSMFFKGGTSEDPDETLVIGVADLTSPLLQAELRKDLLGTAKASVEGMTRSTLKIMASARLDMKECALVMLGATQAGRCAGSAEIEGYRSLVLYVWPTEHGIAYGLYLARGGQEVAAAAMAEALVGSIGPG